MLLSDEICLSKGARDACLILLRAFFHWGLPEEIVSDNAKSFTSLLYRLLMGVLRVKVGYITPGHPWENPFAESLDLGSRGYPLRSARSVHISIHIYNAKRQLRASNECMRFHQSSTQFHDHP